MSGAIPPLPKYAFMAWCSLQAQGQRYLYQNVHISLGTGKDCDLLHGRPFLSTGRVPHGIQINKTDGLTGHHFNGDSEVSVQFHAPAALPPELKTRLCGPPSLLSNGYRGPFPQGKAAGA
jgi:hypothetical protein